MRKGALLCFIVAWVLVGAGAGAQYGGESVDITLTDSDGNATNRYEAGEQGTANVSGLMEDETYDLGFEQSPAVIIGTGTTNGSGALALNFTIPSTASVGQATLTFDPRSTDDGDESTTIQIVAAQADDTADTGADADLPDTGANVRNYVLMAIILIAVGTAIVLAIRLRRRTAGGV